MQTCRPVLIHALHLRDQQIPFAKERPDGQFVRTGALAQYAAGKVDGGEGQVSEERSGEVDFPAFGLDLDDAADDEIANLRRVARAEGPYGEEFVGFDEGAGDRGKDLGSARMGVGSVTAGNEVD